jgi:hypothetical protein
MLVKFKVLVPAAEADPQFLVRHPWMRRGVVPDAVSWEIGFAATGHAISFKQSTSPISQAAVSHIRPSEIPQRWLTRGLLTGEGNNSSLSNGGKQMLALVLDDCPKVE